MKQKLTELKREIENSTIIVKNFNTPLSIIYRAPREKINKKMENFNDIINQLDLIDFCGTLN